MKMIKTAFLSTSSRTIDTLVNLFEDSRFDVKLIITKTDKKIGRSGEKESNLVKNFAINHNLELIEIEKMNPEIAELIIDKIKNLQIELGVSFDFGFIIPKAVLEFPKHKIINIHFSLLPKHRGASAVQGAILNDEKEYGITYHLIAPKLDTGDIIYQVKKNLNENWTSEEAYKNLFEYASEITATTIFNYVGGVLSPTPQNEDEASYTYSKTYPKFTTIFKEDAFSDLEVNERKIFRMIKAYNPWPILHTNISNLNKLRQFKPFILKENIDPATIIKIIDADFLNNELKIKQVIVSNGKRLNIRDFINGYFRKV